MYCNPSTQTLNSVQRIATATCSGGPLELKLERFSEVLDASTGLTYAALTSQNKQSVREAERLFSKGVMEFMKKYGFRKLCANSAELETS